MIEDRLGKNQFSDALFTLYDNADRTKKTIFQLSTISTGNTRTLTVPDASGTIAVEGQDVTFTSLTLDLTQNYKFSDRATALTIQSQTAATPCNIELSSLDGDGTDNVLFSTYAIGTPAGLGNAEFMSMGYLASGTIFEIRTGKLLTGTVRPLRIYTGANTTQLVLNADNSIDMSGDLSLPFGDFVSEQNPDGADAIRIKGT
ncbi:hypothetical protein LCGC14_2225440, partial [marine sediment metagenome]